MKRAGPSPYLQSPVLHLLGRGEGRRHGGDGEREKERKREKQFLRDELREIKIFQAPSSANLGISEWSLPACLDNSFTLYVRVLIWACVCVCAAVITDVPPAVTPQYSVSPSPSPFCLSRSLSLPLPIYYFQRITISHILPPKLSSSLHFGQC